MRSPRSFSCTVARACDQPLRDTLLGSSKGRDYRIEYRSRQRFTPVLHNRKRPNAHFILLRALAFMPAAQTEIHSRLSQAGRAVRIFERFLALHHKP
jgi:hypothetical protein